MSVETIAYAAREATLNLLDGCGMLYAILLTAGEDILEHIQMNAYMKIVVWILVVGYLVFRCVYWYWKAVGKKNQVKYYKDKEEPKN